jgi:hypothetical protein
MFFSYFIRFILFSLVSLYYDQTASEYLNQQQQQPTMATPLFFISSLTHREELFKDEKKGSSHLNKLSSYFFSSFSILLYFSFSLMF